MCESHHRPEGSEKEMVKVYVRLPLNDEQKKRLEAISPEYEFVYKEDYDAQIIIGSPRTDTLQNYKDLKLIQTSSVGVEGYIKKGVLKDGTVLCNAVDVHTVEVAEHCLAMLLSMMRKFYLYRDDQTEHKWKDEGKVKELKDLKVTILGLGNIGKHLAKQLKALGVYVIGVKRTAIEKPDYIDELYTNKDLEKAIGDVDAVISILPGNKENAYLFDVDTFRKMRPDTIFINVGRGNLYTEETLRQVLDEKIVAAVAADVYLEEPLPKDSPLWDYKNLIITPHVAGNYRLDSAKEAFVDLAEENLRRYINREELKYVVSERD